MLRSRMHLSHLRDTDDRRSSGTMRRPRQPAAMSATPPPQRPRLRLRASMRRCCRTARSSTSGTRSWRRRGLLKQKKSSAAMRGRCRATWMPATSCWARCDYQCNAVLVFPLQQHVTIWFLLHVLRSGRLTKCRARARVPAGSQQLRPLHQLEQIWTRRGGRSLKPSGGREGGVSLSSAASTPQAAHSMLRFSLCAYGHAGGPDAGLFWRPEVAAPRGGRQDAPAARRLPAVGAPLVWAYVLL